MAVRGSRPPTVRMAMTCGAPSWRSLEGFERWLTRRLPRPSPRLAGGSERFDHSGPGCIGPPSVSQRESSVVGGRLASSATSRPTRSTTMMASAICWNWLESSPPPRELLSCSVWCSDTGPAFRGEPFLRLSRQRLVADGRNLRLQAGHHGLQIGDLLFLRLEILAGSCVPGNQDLNFALRLGNGHADLL